MKVKKNSREALLNKARSVLAKTLKKVSGMNHSPSCAFSDGCEVEYWVNRALEYNNKVSMTMRKKSCNSNS